MERIADRARLPAPRSPPSGVRPLYPNEDGETSICQSNTRMCQRMQLQAGAVSRSETARRCFPVRRLDKVPESQPSGKKPSIVRSRTVTPNGKMRGIVGNPTKLAKRPSRNRLSTTRHGSGARSRLAPGPKDSKISLRQSLVDLLRSPVRKIPREHAPVTVHRRQAKSFRTSSS